MRQSTSSLLFTLLFLAITCWIIWVAFQETDFKEAPVKEIPEAHFWEEFDANVIRYKAYNENGEWTLEVKAEKIEQLGEDKGTVVSGAEASYRKPNGKVLRISADFLKDEGNNKVFSSAPGHLIHLGEEGGLELETPGPLVVTPSQEFRTHNRTQFKFHQWSGECLNLVYKPDRMLELYTQVKFQLRVEDGETSLEADEISLDITKSFGQVKKGRIVMSGSSLQGQGKNRSVYFESEQMGLFFQGILNRSKILLSEIEISGPESVFSWDQGSIRAPYFSACMESDGQYPHYVTTHGVTRFDVKALGDQRLFGETADLSMDFFEALPLSLVAEGALSLEADSQMGDKLTLKGGKGFMTEFDVGRAENTRIYGSPEFHFGPINGRSGFFRILHGQHKLIMSQTAELRQELPESLLSAEEILVSNWDLADREIFGRAFIRFDTQLEGRKIEGTGDELLFNDFEGKIQLKGDPAIFEQGQNLFSAKQFEIGVEGGALVNTSISTDVSGRFTADGTQYSLTCRELNYSAQESVCRLQSVESLKGGDVGSLSADKVELHFLQDTPDFRLKEVVGQGHILLTGKTRKGDEDLPFSGQADIMRYDPEINTLFLEGDKKDVILRNSEGYEINGRRLIYSLSDATMRVEAGEHSTTQTIVNIKKEKSN